MRDKPADLAKAHSILFTHIQTNFTNKRRAEGEQQSPLRVFFQQTTKHNESRSRNFTQTSSKSQSLDEELVTNPCRSRSPLEPYEKTPNAYHLQDQTHERRFLYTHKGDQPQ